MTTVQSGAVTVVVQTSQIKTVKDFLEQHNRNNTDMKERESCNNSSTETTSGQSMSDKDNSGAPTQGVSLSSQISMFQNSSQESPQSNDVTLNAINDKMGSVPHRTASLAVHEDKTMDVPKDGSEDSSHPTRLRSRKNRTPVNDRVRQKRHILQDMTRPLKQWLYSHRENPYPTKSEKVSLALNSQMTLTQVSNWFANARRRLKNTVRDPNLTWGKRIKMYNSHVEGNAELLSVSSEDSLWDSEEELKEIAEDNRVSNQPSGVSAMDSCPPAPTDLSVRGQPQVHHPPPTAECHSSDVGEDPEGHQPQPQPQQCPLSTTMLHGLPGTSPGQNTVPQGSDPSAIPTMSIWSDHSVVVSDNAPSTREVYPHEPVSQEAPTELYYDEFGQAHKYKHSILHRYLNDTYHHSLDIHTIKDKHEYRKRHSSGSLSSHDYEDISTSSRSTPTPDTSLVEPVHREESELERMPTHAEESPCDEDLHWLEISAALALTNLARSRYRVQPTVDV